MTSLLRYEPFRDAMSLRNAIDQLFEQSFVRPFSGRALQGQGMYAPMDVIETEQGYQVRALLPGVQPEDLELTVQENTLTLKGQLRPWMRDEENANWLMKEIGGGTFERSITFPRPINTDQVETSYEQGVLSVSVPVSEASKPKKISLGSSRGQPQLADAGTD
jgi:HSP20 family protein